MAKILFWQSQPAEIPLLVLSGVIGRMGRFQQGLSYLGLHHLIEKAFCNPKIPAVALLVNSPGGSPAQSALIARAIRQRAEKHKIPVLTFIEDVAASGGYWLACAGDEIYAEASSLIGSIGVISAGFGFTELIAKIGVERRVYTAGERKMMLDSFSPVKAEDEEKIKSLQQSIHEEFKTYVQERRGTKIPADKDGVFNGDIWTGKQALEKGLIDGIGSLEEILQQKFGKKAKFVRMEAKKGLIQRLVSGNAVKTNLGHGFIEAVEEQWWWNRLGL